MKMWSGRFREPLDHDFEQWQRSLVFDWQLLPQEVAASKAHARTIAAAGILTPEELEKIVGALDAIRDEYAQRPPSDIYGRTQAEDIHHFVELELVARIGDLGFKLAHRPQPQRADCDRPSPVRAREVLCHRRPSRRLVAGIHRPGASGG